MKSIFFAYSIDNTRSQGIAQWWWNQLENGEERWVAISRGTFLIYCHRLESGHIPWKERKYLSKTKSSYNWFKIDIPWLLRPPTAVFSHVHSHLNYYIYMTRFQLILPVDSQNVTKKRTGHRMHVEGPQTCQINHWNNSFQNYYGML